MSNKYTQIVTEINPMETAPVWDYYDGGVEVIELFFECNYETISVMAYYDRDYECWLDHYTGCPIYEEPLGWLPNRDYVRVN